MKESWILAEKPEAKPAKPKPEAKPAEVREQGEVVTTPGEVPHSGEPRKK